MRGMRLVKKFTEFESGFGYYVGTAQYLHMNGAKKNVSASSLRSNTVWLGLY